MSWQEGDYFSWTFDIENNLKFFPHYQKYTCALISCKVMWFERVNFSDEAIKAFENKSNKLVEELA